ncbi:unnamed protein product, partial [Musa acuminata var. zebrina]
MADPRTYGGDDANHRQGSGGRRLYSPYHELQIPYRTLYDLPTSPEFLFQEESVVQRRSWGENLTYYTGIGYLTGAAAGASLGLRCALRSAEPGDTLKIRLNRVLNSCGQNGRRIGNRVGVIGLLYAGLESGMVAARDTDDWVNSVVAGLGTGAVFKAANGPRSAAVAGAIGGLMVGAAVAGKQVLRRYEKAATEAGAPPRGCMAVRVGPEGEEQQRFVVPVAHLSHPLFTELLDEAAAEYGFNQAGPIAIPCGIEHFRRVQDAIDREIGGGAGHHHHHH